MKKYKFLAIFFGSIFLISSAVAQITFPLKKKDFLDLHKKDSDAIFDALDTNKDGRLSKEELATPRLKEAESRFDNTDTNKDGVVTEAEEKAALETLRKLQAQQEAEFKKQQAAQKKAQEEQKKAEPKGPAQPKN